MGFLEVLNNPSMVHAAVVHLPVALAVVGIPLVYLCMVVARENEALRWVTAGCYAVLALSAFAAMQSGEGAMGKVPAEIPQDIWDHIEHHEKMGEVVWILGLVTTALIALSALRFKWLAPTVQTLALIASLGTGAWVAMTGHYGGTLVYNHGIGTPAMYQPAAPAPEAATPAPAPTPPAPVDPASFAVAPPADGREPALLPFTMEEAQQISFHKDIVPVLTEVCHECHRPGKARGGLDTTTVEAMLLGGDKAGAAIIPGNPDASPLVKYCRGELQPQMPKGEDPIYPEELRLLRMWIAAGAPDDSATAAPNAPAPTPAPTEAAPEAPQPEPVPAPAESAPAAAIEPAPETAPEAPVAEAPAPTS
ncbi:MAG: hypothetical protein IT365_08415 [Candidatus Hydrogenedentes bacterium]|nr:hypothetical protein [Candidatus Hydrogenedentota bacterium]